MFYLLLGVREGDLVMDMVHRDQSYLFYQIIANDDADLSRVGILVLFVLSHKELVRIYGSSQI